MSARGVRTASGQDLQLPEKSGSQPQRRGAIQSSGAVSQSLQSSGREARLSSQRRRRAHLPPLLEFPLQSKRRSSHAYAHTSCSTASRRLCPWRGLRFELATSVVGVAAAFPPLTPSHTAQASAARRAEATRIMLDIAGVPYEDKRVSHAEWPAIKPTTPFGQVPVLEVDGKQLAQSGAIERYAAKLAKLYPEDPWEAAQVDMHVALQQVRLPA